MGAEFAWIAFWRLHADRPMVTTSYAVPAGMAAVAIVEPRPGYIPFSAVDRYAARFGISGGGFDLLLALIERLDAEFIKWDGERAKQRMAVRS